MPRRLSHALLKYLRFKYPTLSSPLSTNSLPYIYTCPRFAIRPTQSILSNLNPKTISITLLASTSCLSRAVRIHSRIRFSADADVNIAAFPSSEAFDVINDALKSDDAERKDAIKKGQAIFAFTLKNKAGETESWHIDLKNKGEVGKGVGEKPTGQ